MSTSTEIETPQATGLPRVSMANRRARWSKTVLNFWLDMLMATVFLVLMTLDAVIRFVFPAPSKAAGWKLWTFGYDDWAFAEFIALWVLSGCVLVHVMLHWSWVCGMLTRGHTQSKLRTDNGVQTLVGVGVFVAVLHVIGIVVLAGLLTVQRP